MNSPAKEILQITRKIQALAQTGLRFGTGTFDIQRYQELRELSVKLMEQITDAPIEKIRDLFTHETGFQTPKVDIRAVVLKDNQVLLVREKADGKWSLPGGYADVNESPAAMAEKEAWEETGLKVKHNRLLAVLDTNRHDFPPLEYHFYKLVILCDYQSGELRGSDETHTAGFFAFDDLPHLSEGRTSYQMMDLLQKQIEKGGVYFD
jgi:ADP-ribose pyrophosphatase YjhB (NUDIX family)